MKSRRRGESRNIEPRTFSAVRYWDDSIKAERLASLAVYPTRSNFSNHFIYGRLCLFFGAMYVYDRNIIAFKSLPSEQQTNIMNVINIVCQAIYCPLVLALIVWIITPAIERALDQRGK